MEDEIFGVKDSETAEDCLLAEYEVSAFTSVTVEEELVLKAIEGDVAAFEEIFLGTYRYVFAAVRKYLKNDQDVYDAIQETYTKVYKNLSHLESTASFYPWLHRISENCAKDILRLRGRQPETSDLDEADKTHTEDQSGSAEVSADITEVLKQMPKEQVELLVRAYYDKMRVAEIARMQGVPATTVHNRLKAAKKKLRELLKIRGIEKHIYSGELVSMISLAIRNAIGTQLLSIAVAEEILQRVVGAADAEGAAVITAFARKERSRSVSRLATVILLFCVGAIGIGFSVTAFVLSSLPKSDGPSDTGSTPYQNTSFKEDRDDTSHTDAESSAPSSSADSSEASSVSESEGGSESSSSSLLSSSSSSSSAPQFDFYLSVLTEPVELLGSFENGETFGTATENEELDIATVGDTVYAVVKGNLVSLKTGGTKTTLLIEDFAELYGADGKGLNVFEGKVYWMNKNSDGKFLLNRVNIDGTGYYSKVIDDFEQQEGVECTFVTKLTVAKDGVYFVAGRHGDRNWVRSGILYRTDFDFNIEKRIERAVDYTLINDKIYYLSGSGNCGLPFSADRATFENSISVTPDHISYESIYSIGEYLILDSYSPYRHSEYGWGSDLKVMDTVSGKIVRAIFGEADEITDAKDVSALDGGTILIRYNDNPLTMNIKTGEMKLVENWNGTVCGALKYYIENDTLYAATIDGTSPEKIY